MKPVVFRGTSLDDLRAFPSTARREAGHQLDQVQRGLDADDWKPMTTIGQGVKEIRIRDASDAFRVIYVAKFAEAVFVLHCFQKKTQQTSKADYRLGNQALSRVVAGAEPMSKKRFASVWDAIEDTPAEAENMKLRSALMIVIKEYIKSKGWTQSEAAERLGVTQPRVSDLLRGKIDLFGLDTLVNMATSVGLKVQMRVREAA